MKQQYIGMDPLSRESHFPQNEPSPKASAKGAEFFAPRPRLTTALALLTTLAFLPLGMDVAQAKGGTAKPPAKNLQTPFARILDLPTPPLGGFSAAVGATGANLHQFDATGFIQKVTVDNGAMCPGVPAANVGGTVQVNGITVTVPCNSIVQMPANTLTWVQAVDLLKPSLALDGSAGGGNTGTAAKPAFEVSLSGNIVGAGAAATHIAGLVFLSQHSLASGAGVITRIDYNDGSIYVGADTGAADQVRLQINDPNGRFGRAQSPDDRFSVDDENPTIHAATGYPMCVPRTDPATQDDDRCPQKNRPLTASGCRLFGVAGVPLPVSGELAASTGTFCSQFVMKAAPGSISTKYPAPGTNLINVPGPGGQIAGPTDPDPREQAPFEVGDYINYSGTLMTGNGGAGPGGADYISAHTIEANVGIYTQPGTQPNYLAIGEFGVGTADPATAAPGGAKQETQNRIFLEAETTDVKMPVDIYMVDVNPVTGAETNRWITPWEMTGECDPAVAPAPGNTCLGVSGGITTQNTGPQPQRARIRATKAILNLLSQPSRTIRVMARSLCTPTAPLPVLQASGQTLFTAVPGDVNACLAGQAQVANGLVAGQYLAPVFEYIFPEGTQPGSPVVPNDFWHLPFLIFGEGPGTGPLIPTPW
jgi:hypothetical protein